MCTPMLVIFGIDYCQLIIMCYIPIRSRLYLSGCFLIPLDSVV